MINIKSKNIKINGYYGTYEVIDEFKYENNIAFLVDNEDDYYKGETMIIDCNRKVLIEDGKNKNDFIKWINDLEFYCGGFRMDYR